MQPAKTAVSFCFSPLRTFRQEGHLRLDLRRKRYLTPVSNVYEGALISLFWTPKTLNELSEMRFEFCFKLIGKSTMAF